MDDRADAAPPETGVHPWPELLAELATGQYLRILVVGESGSGKTTLIRTLTEELQDQGHTCYCLSCDPGLPGFGAPGTMAIGHLRGERWQVLTSEPLCSLDASRFRLPLLLALSRLMKRAPRETLFLDSPGVVRGVGGSELLPAMAGATAADLCLVLTPAGAPPPLSAELATLSCPVIHLTSSHHALPLRHSERVMLRNQAWQEHMAHRQPLTLDPAGLTLLGTPPPLSDANAWRGRQIALLKDNEFRVMGQVVEASPKALMLEVAADPGPVDQLLVRDAAIRDGQLRTLRKKTVMPEEPPAASEVRVELGALTSTAREPQVAVRIGQVVASLVNGVTGDPLLQLRMLHESRSLLFDLGDAGRMPLRAAHQVSDVFLTHAHADHIGGFVWLMRSRIGYFPPCRMFGPPGLHRHIQGMVGGIRWDRVEDRGPCFIIHEWFGDHLRRWRVTAGVSRARPLAAVPVQDGVILREPGFMVRATELDHGIPVLAYSYEPRLQLHVRRERLDAMGLAPGPWLQELKQAWLRDELERTLSPAAGVTATIGELASQLLIEEPGDRIAYATDFRDSPENIRRLTTLARGAHTLFCESSFLNRDADQAERTQHLTTEACARIANLAEVRQLVAFHFSHRYEKQREQVYRELRQHTDRLIVPGEKR